MAIVMSELSAWMSVDSESYHAYNCEIHIQLEKQESWKGESVKKAKIKGDKSCLPELESTRKGPISQDAQGKEENAPLALHNPNAVQVSKPWRNFGFLGGKQTATKEGAREGGRGEEAFPAEINFVPGPPRLASPAPGLACSLDPICTPDSVPSPNFVVKRRRKERGNRCDSYCLDSNARIPCIAIEIGVGIRVIRHQ